MVLVGVQPSLMQVPPTCSRSIMAVFHPAPASALESGVPACPEPITIALYCTGWVISVYLFLSLKTSLAMAYRSLSSSKTVHVGNLAFETPCDITIDPRPSRHYSTANW